MTRQKRKAIKSKPITAHPLFSAVVALWFGALLGLGSLAIRPTLIESLVIRSRVDLVVPAAAPPLGVTARILIALLLAAIGAMIGVALARRMTRQKPAPRQRQRDARSMGEGSKPTSRFAPVAASGHFNTTTSPVSATNASGRRRALAIEHDEEYFVPHDMAPLPGGGQPQILDIGGMGLNDDRIAVSPEPLDLGEFAQDSVAPMPVPPVAVSLAPAVVAENLQQPFQPNGIATAESLSQPETESAALAGRQVFGISPPVPQVAEPRQIFGDVAASSPFDADALSAAGYQASVFDTPPAAELFPQRLSVTEDRPEPASPALPIETATGPDAEPQPSPADKQGQPDIASLGMVSLAERLAASMQRRRDARAAATTDGEIPTAQAEPAQPAAPPPPVPAPLPASLRPISFEDFGDEGDSPVSELLPPWRIQPVQPAAPVVEDVSAANSDPADGQEEGEASAGEAQDYASLLNIGPGSLPRNPFVRIEEPDVTGAEIEPVVIFPGQASRVAPFAPVANGNDAQSEQPTPFRRFDAPSNAGPGQPVEAAPNASALDAGETERALRSALANLQRMSGAA